MKWKRRKAECFKRDNYTCQYTGRVFSEHYHELEAHHRVFKSQKGDDALDNLASIWSGIHTIEHGKLKHARLLTERDDSKIDGLRKRYL